MHQKLFEKNAALRRSVEAFANENLGGACRQMQNLLSGCQKTQVYFQVRWPPVQTNIGTTRATPMAKPLVVISDWVKIWVALRVLLLSLF